MYPDKHVHLGESPTARHIEFGPQGAGSQGVFFGGGSSVLKQWKVYPGVKTSKNNYKIIVFD